MQELCEDYQKGDFWQVDQNFLRDVVYPLIKDKSMVHDFFFENNFVPGLVRDPKHFIGQAYAGCGRILDAEEYFQEFMMREYNAKRS